MATGLGGASRRFPFGEHREVSSHYIVKFGDAESSSSRKPKAALIAGTTVRVHPASNDRLELASIATTDATM
jgi:hypothetical protein